MFYISGAGTWSFNSMQSPEEIHLIPSASEKVHSGAASSSASWNPDAIDVTLNPNKGRKITTEREKALINRKRIISTTENILKESTLPSIGSGLKDGVLQSNDYQLWQQMKNSFLFEPASVEITTIIPTSLAAPVTTMKSNDIKVENNNDLLIGGSQAPELEIQHELNHFPSFPTKRVPREYLSLQHGNGGQSYHVFSTTASPSLIQSVTHTNNEGLFPPSSTRKIDMLEPEEKSDKLPIIMEVPPELQEGIPDGYELLPIDRITDEYEIIPWKEVKTLLNINISQYPTAPGHLDSGLPVTGSHPEYKTLAPFPSTTYGPPTSPYEEAGYSQDNYLPALHAGYHDVINEVVKPWYVPPPISPDLPNLPTLYYDDLGNIKMIPKPKLPGLIKGHDPHAPPKSIKGLKEYDPRIQKYLHKHSGSNVIHFGSDFGPTPPPTDHSHINGYKVTPKPPIPAFIKNIFHSTSTTPYPTWKEKSTTPKPIYYSTSTTPYSKVKYSTPKPTTVKSLYTPEPSYSTTPHAPPVSFSTTHHPYTSTLYPPKEYTSTIHPPTHHSSTIYPPPPHHHPTHQPSSPYPSIHHPPPTHHPPQVHSSYLHHSSPLPQHHHSTTHHPKVHHTTTLHPPTHLPGISHPSPGYLPPHIHPVTPKPHRKPHALTDISVPVPNYTPSSTTVQFSTVPEKKPEKHFDSASYSLFNFYTTPSPVYKPEEEKQVVKPYHPPHLPHKEPHHEPHIPHHEPHVPHHEPHVPHHEPYVPHHDPHIPHPSPEPHIKVHNEPYHPPKYEIEDPYIKKPYIPSHRPHPTTTVAPYKSSLAPYHTPVPHYPHIQEAVHKPYPSPTPHGHHTPTPLPIEHPHESYHSPKPHIHYKSTPVPYDPYHTPSSHIPKHHPDPYHKPTPPPHYDPYHSPKPHYKEPHQEPHYEPYHHDPYDYHPPKPPSYHEKPHADHLHPYHHGKKPALGYHYHPDHYKVPEASVSHLPSQLQSYLPVGFHSIYNGPGTPPKYPPVPLGEPPSYPPRPYLLGLNQTKEKFEKIKIEDVEALKEALKKAGVGPGSSKKVYLVKEENGETSVQISLPVEDLFEGEDSEFQDRDSQALDLSILARANFSTTPLTTASPETTTETTTKDATPENQSAQLMKFEMNDFWIQMQKLFKPGQILMANKDGVKLNNVLIAKGEKEDTEEDEYDDYAEYEEVKDRSDLKMDLIKLPGSQLDLRDLIRGRKEVAKTQQPVPHQERINIFRSGNSRRTSTQPTPNFQQDPIFNAVPTNRIFVPDERFRFSQTPLFPDARPETDNLLIVTPEPPTTRFTAYPPSNLQTTTNSPQSQEMLQSLRKTLDDLVNKVQGLNDTVIDAMEEKTKEIRKEEPGHQIRPLQIEIASLTKMVHDLKMQKQSQDFMSLFTETQNMIKKQEKKQELQVRQQQEMQQKLQVELEEKLQKQLDQQQEQQREQHMQKQKQLEQQKLQQVQLEKELQILKQLEIQQQKQQQEEQQNAVNPFIVTPQPSVITTTSTTTRPTTRSTEATTPYNWFTSKPTTSTTLRPFPLQTFQSISVLKDSNVNIDSGLVSNNLNKVIFPFYHKVKNLA